jgi:hypothetical protein
MSHHYFAIEAGPLTPRSDEAPAAPTAEAPAQSADSTDWESGSPACKTHAVDRIGLAIKTGAIAMSGHGWPPACLVAFAAARARAARHGITLHLAPVGELGIELVATEGVWERAFETLADGETRAFLTTTGAIA